MGVLVQGKVDSTLTSVDSELQAHCLLFNARSLFHKMGELHAAIDQSSPDFIFVTETWFNNEITNSMLFSGEKYRVII